MGSGGGAGMVGVWGIGGIAKLGAMTEIIGGPEVCAGCEPEGGTLHAESGGGGKGGWKFIAA